MTHAIRIHRQGGPEEFRWEEITVGDPGPGEARIAQTAAGLNYIDVYHRSGLYPVPALPAIVGMSASGIVEAVGAGVTGLAVGDRVTYGMGPMGAYCEARVMPADRLIKLPDAIDDKVAAAAMLQGMTAQYLLKRTYKVKPGDVILVHAAAGGVGLLLCQWGKALGATVLGTVSTEAKAELARANGAAHVAIHGRDDFKQMARDLTGGVGVPVVYDSIGKDTFLASLDSLAPLGMMVTFGQSSGPFGPLDTGLLAAKGSLFLTRPSLGTYVAKRADLEATANDLFDALAKGLVRISVNQTVALKDAADAHRALESRQTTGSTVLVC